MTQPVSSIANGPGRGLLRAGRVQPWLVLLLLVALVGLIYGPTLNFTFYEEDPSDFDESRGKSLDEIFAISTSELYYRPVHLAYFQLMSVPFDFDPRGAHWLRLGIHVANAFLLYLLVGRLWGQPLVSLASAALMAIHPMSVHAIARLTASQVPMTLGVLLALWLYVEARLTGRWWLGGLSVVAMACALLVQESAAALLPMGLLLELYLVRTGRVEHFEWRWLAGFGLAIAGFAAVWLQIEKTGTGFLEESFSFGGVIYLVQAAVFPLARLLGALDGDLSMALIASVYLVGLAALAAWYVLRGRGWEFVGLLAFYAGVLIPTWAVKEFEYFIIGERTLYMALPFAAALWGGLLLEAGPGRARLRPPRWVAPLALAIAALVGVFDSLSLVRLHGTGSDLMRQIVSVQAHADQTGHLLFVNVPDRFRYQHPPYPIGDWGMVVAPVSMDLSRYGVLRNGFAPQTRSLTAWGLAAGDVEQTPYWLTTRGPDSGLQALYEAASWADSVYSVAYEPSAFTLREVGAVAPSGEASGEVLATFGDAVRLLDAETEVAGAGRTLSLTLRWQAVGEASPDETIFVHVSGPDLNPVVQADGDALGGLLPLTAWNRDDIIEDRRTVTNLPPGDYAVIVGLYNRSTGERLPVSGAAEVIPGGVRVGQVNISS